MFALEPAIAEQVAFHLSVLAGAAVSAFAGFAFSPVAAVGLIFLLPHDRLIPLLMMLSVVVQLVTLLYFRRAIVWKNVGPMLCGGSFGVVLAVALFQAVDERTFKTLFGAFLAVYALAMLWRPTQQIVQRTTPARDAVVGFAGGLVGGLTAMPGAVPVIYCDLRAVPKEVQRATVQSFILMMQVLAIALFAFHGAVTPGLMESLVSALPALGLGIGLGLFLFGRVPDRRFRQSVLVLLLVTGVAVARPVSLPSSAAQPALVVKAVAD